MTIEPRTPRRYNSSLRSRQAAETRSRILDAAGMCFAASGYGGTTLAAVAARAEVSVETVQAHGPKRALLLNAFERAFGGVEGPQLLTEQPVGRELLELPDLDTLVRRMIEFIAAANARTSGLWRAFNAAADGDADVRSDLDDLLARRRRDLTAATGEFIERGARIDDAERACGALYFLISPEGYHQLVTVLGWPMDAYVEWLHDAVHTLVIGAPKRVPGRPRRSV